MTEKQFEDLNGILTSEYGFEIDRMETETVFIWDDGTTETVIEKEKVSPSHLIHNPY